MNNLLYLCKYLMKTLITRIHRRNKNSKKDCSWMNCKTIKIPWLSNIVMRIDNLMN